MMGENNSPSVSSSIKFIHKGKIASPEELPLKRAARFGEEVINEEYELIWEDGVRKFSIWNARPLYDKNGIITGAISTFNDITDQKLFAEKILESEERYKAVFENSMDGILLTCTDGTIISANQSACKMLGYSEEELRSLGRNGVVDLSDPRLPVALEERNRTGFLKGELTFVRKDGKKIQVEGTCRVFKDQDDNKLTSTVLRDITERKRLQKELDKYRFNLEELVKVQVGQLKEKDELIQLAHDAIIVSDLNFKIMSWNKGAEEIYGWAYYEANGKNICDFLNTEFPISREDKRKALFNTGRWDGELVQTTKDGSKVIVFSRQVIKRDKYGKPIAILEINSNITEQKIAQTALQISEERFSKAFHFNPIGLFICTLEERRFVEANNSFLKTIGYNREEIIGRAASELNILSPDEYAKSGEILKKEGVLYNIQVNIRRKDGVTCVGVMNMQLIEIYNKKCIMGAFEDITEKKAVEVELARLDKLNLVGEIAAGIGHEIRNPMTTVRGFLQLLSNKPLYLADHQYFELMISEIDRANEIITQFLSLAKNKRVVLKKMSLNTVLRNVCPLIQADALKSDKEIILNSGDIPEILVDENEILQLILNLVRNGLEAMHSGGTLYVKTYSTGSEVVLEVEDRGYGIPQEVINKVGQPFITTKDDGTGLGLSVCYSICARHNAKIDFKTSTEGTTFYVRFPINTTTDQ